MEVARAGFARFHLPRRLPVAAFRRRLGIPDFLAPSRVVHRRLLGWSGITTIHARCQVLRYRQSVSPTDLLPMNFCIYGPLGCHVAIGLIVSYLGCIRSPLNSAKPRPPN